MPSKTAAFRLAKKEAEAKTNFTGEKPSFILYSGVLVIALLKDLLDLAFIGSLPGIGTVITMCFTILIWLLLTAFDRSGGQQNIKMTRSIILIAIAIVEGIGFGLNFLPIQTLTIVLLYQMARRAWKKAQEEKNKNSVRVPLGRREQEKIRKKNEELLGEIMRKNEEMKRRGAFRKLSQTQR